MDNAHFGQSLSWGDFDGNGAGDLAIGSPSLGPAASLSFGSDPAGAVFVLYGIQTAGLTLPGSQLWTENIFGDGNLDAITSFGMVLTSGDFNGDGRSDLAIGVPLASDCASNTCKTEAGLVDVIFGGPGGLNQVQTWSQDTAGILGTAAASDHFGASLAAGDFNGDGKTDLAIGVPLKDADATDSGVVNVLYGWVAGLSATGSVLGQESALRRH
jgi:hypothetical protein